MDKLQNFYLPLDLGNHVELQLIGIAECSVKPQNWSSRNFVRPYDALFGVVEGEVYEENESGRFRLRAGDVRLFPVNCVFSHWCDAPARILAVRFQAQFKTGFGLLDGVNQALVAPALEAHFWEACTACREANGLTEQVAMISVVWRYVSKFLAANAGRNERFLRSLSKYGRVFELLRDAPGIGLQVQDLARAMGMTPGNLSTQFRQDMGISLKQYMTQQAVKAAGERLLLTHAAVKEIAFDLGFSDPLYFSRFFRKHTGLSPRRFRRSERLLGE